MCTKTKSSVLSMAEMDQAESSLLRCLTKALEERCAYRSLQYIVRRKKKNYAGGTFIPLLVVGGMGHDIPGREKSRGAEM